MWCSLTYVPWDFSILHIQGMQCGDPQHLVFKKSGKTLQIRENTTEPELCFAYFLPFSSSLCHQAFPINTSPLSYAVPEPE